MKKLINLSALSMFKLSNKVLIAIVCFAAVILSSCGKKQVATVSPTPIPPTPTPAETQLPPEQRPVVSMTPDAKKQNVSLKIDNLPKDVESVDYELMYLTNGVEKGSLGTYYLDKKKNEILLGSCSSGTCNYDTNITNGTLTIMYITDGQDILLRYPFNP